MRSTIFFLLLSLGLVLSQNLNNIKVSTTTLDARYLRWIDDDIGILMTNDGHVWRSKDSGVSWSDITDKLPHAKEANNAPNYLFSNRIDNTKFFVRGEGQYCWTSLDKGLTWTAVQPGFVIFNIFFHPNATFSNRILAVESSSSDIYYSPDFGGSWTSVAQSAYLAGWGDSGLGSVPPERIYLIMTGKNANSRDFVQTDNFGSTYDTIVPGGYLFVFLNNQLFIMEFDAEATKAILKVSPDVGQYYKGIYITQFPYGTSLEYNGYRVLDDSTGAVYLGVNHGSWVSDWGNVYVSDSVGVNYISSLEHVPQAYPFYDFVRVKSVEGIYIGNVIENWNNNQEDNKVKTMVTRDNGGNWGYLSPPHFDSQNQPIICSGKCSLHLHGELGAFIDVGYVYSTDSSVGLVLGIGNIGQYLSFENSELNTYLSRDAGLTWIELAKMPLIAEIADHGGIIILAPFNQLTDTFYFTLDQGASGLQSYKFIQNNQLVTVVNIITEPTSTSTKFIIVAQQQTASGVQTVLFGVDFTSVFDRTCSDNDYEQFSPSDILGQNCLLGHDIVYRRKKQTAECFNPDDLEKIISVTNCPCDLDDWECDFSFQRTSTGTCELIPGVSLTYPPGNCYPGTTYNKTKGYRKVAGDTCEKGIDYTAEGPFDCPSKTDNTTTTTRYYLIPAIILPIVCVIVTLGVAIILIKNEKIREKLPFLKAFDSLSLGYSSLQQQNLEGGSLMDDDEENNENKRKKKSQDNDEEDEEQHAQGFSIDNALEEPKGQSNVGNLIDILNDSDEKKNSGGNKNKSALEQDDFNPRL